jgi:hypothetical protein
MGYGSHKTRAGRHEPGDPPPRSHRERLARLNEETGGRKVLGIASGDSAVYTLEERPARLAEMTETLMPPPGALER